MVQGTSEFGISAKFQEMLCFLAQEVVFEDAETIIKKVLNVAISAKQIQRLSEHHGEKLEQQQASVIEQDLPPAMLKEINEQDKVYMMMDGSMVFTREDGWKEMKVGRIFSSKDCVSIQENRNEITQSIYVCHFGEHKKFFEKWEAYVQPYKNKICIADGAKWLWNWVEDTHPEAVQILDFFHAVEKATLYAKEKYPDDKQRKQWIEQQKEKLRNNEVAIIIEELNTSTCSTQTGEKMRQDCLRYFQNNEKRMQYKTYLDNGYLIGSGAIEAAHRNVVQQRLKLSGQRWSIKGAQQIVNLRAYNKSNRWNEVVNLIKKSA